ncbi:hypothetical protein NDU88_006722 [Pleurodeles waltl]|uniref:Uncharacterized protein n=1 Tax=Pleurodeles waltl TaxID=8319 RepID=A0AAV7VNF8_PLEWA|nr:hypothetical protein NDU88_006722 [Pleurodeles waltl]
MSSTRKTSPHEEIEQRDQRQKQPDKGSSEVFKVEHSEAEADPNIEADFDDLSQEQQKELLASYSEKEKECLTAHQESRSPASYQSCGGSRVLIAEDLPGRRKTAPGQQCSEPFSQWPMHSAITQIR